MSATTGLCFGVCHKNTQANAAMNLNTSLGTYTIRADGNLMPYLGTALTTNFVMGVGDIIEISYNPIRKIVNFLNKNKKLE